ncbi:MAG TPA: N-6 DNA methylase [Bacteroidia bacterium]|nr:N-6 DNA methylase [Bacteroidia bacterium]
MLKQYLSEIANTTIQGDAREESYYLHLSNLVKAFSDSIGKTKTHITILPKKTEAGNPDFRIWDGQLNIIGYIEAKVPGSDLNKIESSEQLKRYRETFPNVILTDFYEFRLYREGKLIEKTFIGRPFIAGKLKTPPPIENEEAFTKLFDKFFSFSLPQVFSAEALAIELAKRTRFLKEEVIHQELEDEENNGNQVLGFYDAFQKYLIAGLTKEEFADLYAQTIAYGLFAARTRSVGEFSRRLAYSFIPPTIGILKDVFQFISLGNLPQQMEVIVDEIAAVLNTTDISAILTDYYKKGKGQDPIIHFYETFLNKYDPKTREQRGVYYTPEPVVNYIVNSLNEVLKDEFGKEDGFANTDVTVLDPAGGTLTFLAQTAKFAIEDFTEKYGEGHRANFIKDHILKNFYAFELMMAPYAIAHLKMSFLLDEYGYKMQDTDRFKLYLTNSLEVEDLEQTRIPGMASLSEESKQATLVKRKQPILAIMGNPPYSIASYNNSVFIDGNGKKGKDEIKGLMDLYKEDVKDEKNIQLLSDDYAKFIRFCHWKIEEAGQGVMGLITKNTYLNTSAFKGLRKKMLESFDKVYVYNLHGKLYEKTPSGGKDQNVFDIRVGTAILIGVKTGKKKEKDLGKLLFAELYGDRNTKYDFLNFHNINNTSFEELKTDKAYYFFEKKNFNDVELYNSFFKINEIFILNNTGIETGRDHFVLADTKKELETRFNLFITSNLPLEFLRETFDLNDQPNFKLDKVKSNFKKYENSRVEKYYHKPFYYRHIYYDNMFLRRHSGIVMKHLKGENDNFALILKKSSTEPNYSHCFCSNTLTDRNFLGGQSYVFPLWIFEDDGGLFGASKKSNFKIEFEQILEKQYKQGELTEKIFYYIYAILYSQKYREGFAEQLQIDYPRIPFTSNYKLFTTVSDIGKSIVELHLLTSKELSKPLIKFNGKGNSKVSEIEFKEADEVLYVNETQYFSGISKVMWEWEVGKNKPIQRWIKNAKDKELGLNETMEFSKICTAIYLTFEKQLLVDSVYTDILTDLIKSN